MLQTTPHPRPQPRTRWARLFVALTVLGGIAGCTWVAGRGTSQSPPPSAPAPAASAPPETTERFATVDTRKEMRPLSEAEAADYLGDAACKPCHYNAFQEHAASGHKSTLEPVTLAKHGKIFKSSKTIFDDKRGFYYRVRVSDKECLMDYSDGHAYGALAADWAIGSGNHGATFFSEYKPNRYLKLRLSYYPTIRGWYYTPDEFPPNKITGPAGLVHDDATLKRCLLCHVTVLREDAGELNLQASLVGVGCERCHGPGRKHVERVRLRPHDPDIERLAKATPERVLKLCGVCHRSSENASISDPSIVADLPRLQGIALEQSACYKKSGRLTCTTCHQPHADARLKVQNPDATCMSCHQPRKPEGTCPVNSRTGCVSCHMPSQEIATIPFVKVRHHWIRVWDNKAPETDLPAKHAKGAKTKT